MIGFLRFGFQIRKGIENNVITGENLKSSNLITGVRHNLKYNLFS